VRPEARQKLARIAKIGKTLTGACQGLLILTGLVLVIAVYRILTGHGVAIAALNMATQRDGAVTAFGLTIPLPATLLERITLGAVVVLAFGLQMKALLHLRRLFDHYSHGDIFTSSSAREIRNLGITGMLWVIPNVVWVAASFAFSPATTPSSIHLELGWVALGIVVTFISWFMDVAAELREENELTI
jgi:hypothetical protein